MRQQNGSRGRAKAKLRAARPHQQIKNQRQAVLHAPSMDHDRNAAKDLDRSGRDPPARARPSIHARSGSDGDTRAGSVNLTEWFGH